ncbi:hsp90 co-chaperone Cdc37 [Neodiprion pinetum]|uniref:Hsp90 chaperone protein kinase-targeting subunit n=1 Tax=Neodiprion lecontei TaxID=441921 RepID=A0A6J0BA68_NEOLC|nr:hsp90 co-chaperone Cdc37 [Neodiprion lecontei]XP_046428824.1 hsp90 co-chaperone Cdc37 [Neodiprion fabricii]XP_046482637.1 hsp90 co-chaperone Cdc37 [Neodiprion pinetum]XP_046622670.1 hsp90 co-chaperone Cdc37 [Neodiprion virginianus]
MVDYSKWKNIEISDDEDDTHPNIDTPSLFRWRHQARLERMQEQRAEQEKHEREKEEIARKLKEAEEKLSKVEKGEEKDQQDLTSVKKALEELKMKESEILHKEEELKKKEKLQPWNVDTIAQPGFTKTVINTKPARKEDESNLPDEEKENRMKQFVKRNEKTLKEFGMLRRYDDSKKYLQDHPDLVCENTANYLVIWCINLEMEEKHDLMEHVAHQCICMQYILELSKQLDVDPRACVGSFFSRIQIAEVEYKNSFDDELKSFKERIRKRAAEKVAEALKEAEEEERKSRLGPGGLDPVQVFQELPEALQKCFEAQDIPLLQQTIASMPEEEARYHMKRCIDSGLWVPDAKAAKEQQEEEEAIGTPDPE